jgi:hypothetical protein
LAGRPLDDASLNPILGQYFRPPGLQLALDIADTFLRTGSNSRVRPRSEILSYVAHSAPIFALQPKLRAEKSREIGVFIPVTREGRFATELRRSAIFNRQAPVSKPVLVPELSMTLRSLVAQSESIRPSADRRAGIQ